MKQNERIKEYKNSIAAVKKRRQREKHNSLKQKAEARRLKNLHNVRRFREKRKGEENLEIVEIEDVTNFTNRMQKSRAMKKLKRALPQTPRKKAELLINLLTGKKSKQSPTMAKLRQMNIVKSPDEIENDEIAKHVLVDVKKVLTHTKAQRSKDSLVTKHIILAAVSGESVTENRCKKKLASKLEVPIRRLSGGKRIRTNVLRSEQSCWTITKRKVRSDAISDEDKRLAYNFWLSTEISRPTGNKKDVKRERLEPLVYASHMIHILEKTQTEVYTAFLAEYPDIKMSQRFFEKCKPFFVRPVREQDRTTCCCRYHIEFRTIFSECMKQRKLILESTHDRAIVEARYPIFKSQADMFAETLCPKGTNKEHYKTECLNRKCQNCGVANLLLMPEENDTTDEAIEVTWEKCSAREEIQSSYFQRTEVSLHVSIIYRHAVLEYDGKDSTTENPNIIKEHFFVVSNDDKHDHHFVHEVQNQIKEYLNSISYNVSTMHEYTDGCQCQYKSRHCMGDVSNGQQDFGYDRLIRNYFETSHAKGPQDAAGGYVKRQADLAILRRKATIQTAHDFYKFANENLQETRDSSVCLRRVFRFIDNIDRNRDRYFKSIPQNRNIHQIISEREGLLSVRNLSCYSCDSCLLNMAHSCQHTELVGLVKNIQTEKERGCAIVEDISPDDDFEVVDMIRKGSLVALYTDDEGEDFLSNEGRIMSRKTEKFGN
ncbi:unnamed protein product [Mytilus edulis]|uniref:Uncharacterized protein n=1 Tax=Mytilus edulis TaxID=6550 RepID=A0A8S3RU98_MYTED|nr:unnamed protein product [Mytilus edulis]